MMQQRIDDAAWYLRRAAREAPRSLPTRQAMIAAELMRKDFATALIQLDAAQATWPDDAMLHYFAGVAHALAGERGRLRTASSTPHWTREPGMVAARSALAQVESGGESGGLGRGFKPVVVRPWGDVHALQAELDRYDAVAAAMATVRAAYQAHVLAMLGTLGSGPYAQRRQVHEQCPVGELAQRWAAARQELDGYAALGLELEAAYRFVRRHDEAGLTAACYRTHAPT